MFDFFNRLESILDKMCHVIEKLAPVAQAVAPFTGSAAPAVVAGATAANAIATATDKAIEAHLASGGDVTSATAALAGIALAVADSGLVDQATSDKIKQVSIAIPPDILAGLTGA